MNWIEPLQYERRSHQIILKKLADFMLKALLGKKYELA